MTSISIWMKNNNNRESIKVMASLNRQDLSLQGSLEKLATTFDDARDGGDG